MIISNNQLFLTTRITQKIRKQINKIRNYSCHYQQKTTHILLFINISKKYKTRKSDGGNKWRNHDKYGSVKALETSQSKHLVTNQSNRFFRNLFHGGGEEMIS